MRIQQRGTYTNARAHANSYTGTDAEVGQELTVVVQDVVSTMGSWIISYEFTEAEADENTIA